MRISHSLEFPVSDPEVQQRARTAMDVYINRLLKYVGSYTAELGGLDVITFTAGIGENDDDVRRELAEALAPFGVKIDVEANKGRVKEPRIVSAPDSAVTLVVYPTNEELAIARQALTFACFFRVNEAGVPTWSPGLGRILGV